MKRNWVIFSVGMVLAASVGLGGHSKGPNGKQKPKQDIKLDSKQNLSIQKGRVRSKLQDGERSVSVALSDSKAALSQAEKFEGVLEWGKKFLKAHWGKILGVTGAGLVLFYTKDMWSDMFFSDEDSFNHPLSLEHGDPKVYSIRHDSYEDTTYIVFGSFISCEDDVGLEDRFSIREKDITSENKLGVSRSDWDIQEGCPPKDTVEGLACLKRKEGEVSRELAQKGVTIKGPANTVGLNTITWSFPDGVSIIRTFFLGDDLARKEGGSFWARPSRNLTTFVKLRGYERGDNGYEYEKPRYYKIPAGESMLFPLTNHSLRLTYEENR